MNRRVAALENPEENKEDTSNKKAQNLDEVNSQLEQIENRVEALEAFKYFDVTEYNKEKPPAMSFGKTLKPPDDDSILGIGRSSHFKK